MKKALKIYFLITTTALVPVSGCGQSEGSSSRTTSAGSSPYGKAQPAKNAKKPNPENTDTGGGSTASYVFSLDEAEKLSPLVMPLELASVKSQNAQQDASQNKSRDFISIVLEDMMKLAEHKPGRDFDVVVTNDESPNASALNESLVVNKGIISFASNLSLAMVLCHEAAHSTRNHSARSEKYMKEYENKNKAKADKLDAELNKLVDSAWDESTRKFNHKESDYARVKPIWDAFWGEYVTYMKRFESEADVVGGRICANAGFTADEVEKGFTDLFGAFSGFSSSRLGAGTYSVEEKELGEFLHSIYGEDTHPSDKERIAQAKRIKKAFKVGENTEIAQRWLNEFPAISGSKLKDSFQLSPGQLPARHKTPAAITASDYLQEILTRD